MVIGDRIKKERERREWTQTLLAKKIGISKSVMSRIEAGTRPLEDILLMKLSDVLEVTTDYLLGMDTKPPLNTMEEIDDAIHKYIRNLDDVKREKLRKLIEIVEMDK